MRSARYDIDMSAGDLEEYAAIVAGDVRRRGPLDRDGLGALVLSLTVSTSHRWPVSWVSPQGHWFAEWYC